MMGKTEDIETGLDKSMPIDVVSALITTSIHQDSHNNSRSDYQDDQGKPQNGNETKVDMHLDDGKNGKKAFTLFGYLPSQIKWSNVLWLVFIHLVAIYGYIYVSLYPVKFWTVWWIILLAVCAGFGVGCGAHRLWAHRSYKAHWCLRLLLVLMETLSMNGGCYSYARDHRCHHKFVDTNADPKNAKRGFFFAHVGWWMVLKHPDVLLMGKKLSTKDLDDELLIKWQKKLYIPLFVIISLILPPLVPYYVWGEDILIAIFMSAVLRTVVIVHQLFTVNSVAHIWGSRPYNRHIGPTQSKITMWLSMGEGEHNYHHTFSMDYRNSPKTWWESFNPATLFIDVFEALGLAWDLKKPSHTVVKGVVRRVGDPHFYEDKLFREKTLRQRILTGLSEWSTGIFVLGWPFYGPILFKIITHRPVIVF